MLRGRPPADVQRILRQEVAYGCPVKDCRWPFLTWHHFDPPWNIEQHYRLEGMIALCRDHHGFADAGRWSKEEIRALKTAQHRVPLLACPAVHATDHGFLARHPQVKYAQTRRVPLPRTPTLARAG